MSSKQTKKEKKIYCKKGTRRNLKTGVCEGGVETGKGSIITSIKNAVLSINPVNLSERVPEPLPTIPTISNIPKKRKLVIGCSKNYQPIDSDMARKEELMTLTGPKLRIIHSELINDPSVLGTTPGVKTKENLVHLIVCLENEKNRMILEQSNVVVPIQESSAFQNILTDFSPTDIVERPPTPVPSTNIPSISISIFIITFSLVL